LARQQVAYLAPHSRSTSRYPFAAMPSMTLLKVDPEDALQFNNKQASGAPAKTLTLTNISAGNVAYKVKTTAPKSYLVRPSSGLLRPKESKEIQIILQPQAEGGATSTHRFLVQAVAVTGPDEVSREMWAEFTKDQVEEKRLNVDIEDKAPEPAAAVVASKPTDIVTSGATSSTDLKVKYDELVQYTLMLEKEKKRIEDEVKKLQASGGKGGGASTGYGNMHLLIVAVVVLLISYLSGMVLK